MAFTDYCRELMGTVPKLPFTHAGQLVNRAWGRFRDCRLWSFNIVPDAQWWVPEAISTGAVTVTYQSNTITVNSVLAAALNALTGIDPPVASTTLGVGRQIKVGGGGPNTLTSSSGPNYNIVNWDSIVTLTIDKPYGESSQINTSGFQILKSYYAAPPAPFNQIPNGYDATFIKPLTATNRVTGYTIRGKKLWWTQAQLNAVDPQRGGQGDAYLVASYGRNALGQPVFELYPNPVNQATYSVVYYCRWPDLSPTQDFPQMPYNLVQCVMDLARVFATQWALMNIATFPELGRTNWVAAANMIKQEFKEGLIQCLRTDDTIAPAVPFQQGSEFDFPLGGQFLQSHDISSILSAV